MMSMADEWESPYRLTAVEHFRLQLMVIAMERLNDLRTISVVGPSLLQSARITFELRAMVEDEIFQRGIVALDNLDQWMVK
jgi:hypothetical protein